MYKNFFKRFIDILCSIMGLVVFAVPMFIIAIVVKIESKGSAVYKSIRAGKNCKPFKFYKLRSMSIDAPKDIATNKIDGEKYITKVGAFLRKTSLDELPQMWNILIGNMSIVGPRPTVFSEVELIEEREKYGANSVRPGLTGWAQVNGRDVLAQDTKLKALYDGEYVQKITFLKDLKIIWLTIKKVLSGDGVVEGHNTNQQEILEVEQNISVADDNLVIAADIVTLNKEDEVMVSENAIIDIDVYAQESVLQEELSSKQVDNCEESICDDTLTAQNILQEKLNSIKEETKKDLELS